MNVEVDAIGLEQGRVYTSIQLMAMQPKLAYISDMVTFSVILSAKHRHLFGCKTRRDVDVKGPVSMHIPSTSEEGLPARRRSSRHILAIKETWGLFPSSDANYVRKNVKILENTQG